MATTNTSTADPTTTNGDTSHLNGDASPRPLRVVIVGAGIGGLMAAIALRHAGHETTLIERSRFNQELGAAVNLAPNANGLLKRYGIYAEKFGAVPNLAVNMYDSSGNFERGMPTPQTLFSHLWLLAHRVRLHDTLKREATREGSAASGPPAKLLLGKKVDSVDAEKGLVVAQGETYEGDLIIGADGVHSVARASVPGGEKLKAFDSGKSAFRFMLPTKLAKDDPLTAKYIQKTGQLSIFAGPDRRVVIYPTNNDEELNFVCIHPSRETQASGDWNNETSLESMLKVFETFDESITALLRKADPSTLRVWNLLDMDKLPSFVHGKLALLGDSAHPFTPHQGQGAGMAIEDGVSLAAVLPRGTQPNEVSERLSLYNTARYERAHTIQQFSRLAGKDAGDQTEKIDMTKYIFYNFTHDEWDHSTQILREWTWKNAGPVYWRQPVAFGPMPGPRQDHLGIVRKAEHSTFTTASIKFKTSRTMLQTLFPPGEPGKRFSFLSPGSVAYASLSQTTLNKMDWLGGGGYNHLGLYIHGVSYMKTDGSVVRGAYLPILFENLADPIISGREELGMPKVYSSIDVDHQEGKSYEIKTGWQGTTWGIFSLSDLKETPVPPTPTPTPPSNDSPASAPGPPSGPPSGAPGPPRGNPADAPDESILLYRSMPSVGYSLRGQPAEEYAAYVPLSEERTIPKTTKTWTAGKAEFKFEVGDWRKLPTLHHVIERLGEIPVYEVVKATVVRGTGVGDVRAARRVE